MVVVIITIFILANKLKISIMYYMLKRDNDWKLVLFYNVRIELTFFINVYSGINCWLLKTLIGF